VTGCVPDGDPLATFFTPIAQAVDDAQHYTTEALAALSLRPGTLATVQAMRTEAMEVIGSANDIHATLACATFHGIYEEAHTSICCDLAYAFTAMWSVRMVSAWAMLLAAISAVAGYKRFRRQKNLWGPYASVEALEVGSYL